MCCSSHVRTVTERFVHIQAAVGLAESISMSAKAMATAAKRAMGLAVHEKPFSNDEIHGAAGKMEHAPPGSTTG